MLTFRLPLASRLESVTHPPHVHRHVARPDVDAGGGQAPPLVTIGIPTYNRADQLLRAVESCSAQSYSRLEILVSDNASTDRTADVCRAWAQSDPRGVVIVQPHNLGRERNFGAVLQAATGEFFMWLSDDDWLEANYIASCVDGFRRRPTYAMVGGTAMYHKVDGDTAPDSARSFESTEPRDRVRQYLATVTLNGTYYGLMRLRDVRRAAYPITLSGDWYFVAQMAARGKILLLTDAIVHRSLGGDSGDMRRLATSYGLHKHWARDVHLWALRLLVPGIACGHGMFGVMSPMRRALAAAQVALVLLRRWWQYSGRRPTELLRRALHRRK